MSNGHLQANTAFVVHLRSYGFFHSGREGMRVPVLKRTWEHIPGNTLYGALAAALIRLDGIDMDADPFHQGPGMYHELLAAVKAQQIRFTPLLPVGAPIEEDWTGQLYCEQAMRLQAAVYAEGDATPDDHEEALFHTTPHAPLNRDTDQIHEDQLFAIRTHRPLLDYYGFVFADRGLASLLERGLRVLPFIPFGGRGKFSLVEGEVVDQVRLETFIDDIQGWIAEQDGWVRLLTPVVLRDGQADAPLTGAGRALVMSGLRRYRVWRTGRYYDAQKGGFGDPIGVEPDDYVDPDAFLAGGRESEAVLAVPERSRFQLLAGEDPATWFVEGLGNPSWTYLGWGQVVIE
jgi:hypothetical protein